MKDLYRRLWCRRMHRWKPNRDRVGYVSETSRCSESWSRDTCWVCGDDSYEDWPKPEWPFAENVTA